MHREESGRADLAHRWLTGKATEMLITISQSQRERLMTRVGLPSSKLAWVRGAVDLERFRPGLDPRHIRDLHHIPPEALVAGMIARMQSHRGHHLFIDTLDQIVESIPLAFYSLAGRGELKNELVDRIRNHRLAHHLRRIGYRKNDLPETYATLDVMVILVPGSDGTCRAMLEAMACGRAVIGARCGAIADTIEPGVNGWLIEPDNRQDLTRALIDALGNPERTRTMGEAARQYVEQFHGLEEQCRKVMEVYEEALARRRGK
jgi:glycosyltransferase involved in cell wall biosynthesis